MEPIHAWMRYAPHINVFTMLLYRVGGRLTPTQMRGNDSTRKCHGMVTVPPYGFISLMSGVLSASSSDTALSMTHFSSQLTDCCHRDNYHLETNRKTGSIKLVGVWKWLLDAFPLTKVSPLLTSLSHWSALSACHPRHWTWWLFCFAFFAYSFGIEKISSPRCESCLSPGRLCVVQPCLTHCDVVNPGPLSSVGSF